MKQHSLTGFGAGRSPDRPKAVARAATGRTNVTLPAPGGPLPSNALRAAPSAGVAGAGARALPCLMQNKGADSAFEVVANVPLLPKSALACWWSISHLIRKHGACYLWTHTCPDVVPDHWFGNMHRRLVTNVHDAAKRQTSLDSNPGVTLPVNWGGVRVFEVHPSGHGLHAHWVMRGYMDWYLMDWCARRAGLGRVSVEPEPVSLAAAYYLANYLTKEDKVAGVRQWMNIGAYEGIRIRDIETTSPRIEAIKDMRGYFIGRGHRPYTAYRLAVQAVEERCKPNAVRDDPF